MPGKKRRYGHYEGQTSRNDLILELNVCREKGKVHGCWISFRSLALRRLETEWCRVNRHHTRTTHKAHLSPDPAGAGHLFAGLATAGLGQDGLPFDVALVVGVDGSVDVQRVLQVLPSAGVDHGPLMCIS